MLEHFEVFRIQSCPFSDKIIKQIHQLMFQVSTLCSLVARPLAKRKKNFLSCEQLEYEATHYANLEQWEGYTEDLRSTTASDK